MKIQHRVPTREMVSDPITEKYQAEVDRATAALERRYAKAVKALAAAEARAARLTTRKSKPSKEQVKSAWEVVEQRRQELAELLVLMQPPGASAQHRGRKSFRPAPPTRGTLL